MQIEKHNFDQECGFTLGDYYHCDDIDPLLEELETLRASKRIKQANIELLEAENAKLIAERDKWMQYSAAVNKVSAFKSDDLNNLQGYIYELTSERDALLAEREAMMKQEPVAYEHTFAISDDGAKFTIYTTKKEHQEAESTRPLYAGPLPAQQIPEGYAQWIPVAVVQQSTYEDDNDLKWLTEFGVHSLEVGDKLYKCSPLTAKQIIDDMHGLIEG